MRRCILPTLDLICILIRIFRFTSVNDLFSLHRRIKINRVLFNREPRDHWPFPHPVLQFTGLERPLNRYVRLRGWVGPRLLDDLLVLSLGEGSATAARSRGYSNSSSSCVIVHLVEHEWMWLPNDRFRKLQVIFEILQNCFRYLHDLIVLILLS